MVDLYWIEGPPPGRIGVMPRPYGGEGLADDLRDLRRQGVDAVVSLLEISEIRNYELEREAEFCAASGMDFLWLPIRDHTAPKDLKAATVLARELAARYRDGKNIIVHCLGGVGRSPTIAGAALLELGLEVEDLIRRMQVARGYPVPEMVEQHLWLQRYSPATKQPD